MQTLSYRTVLLAQTGICFRDSSDGIEEYTTSVNGFINKCNDDVVPTVPVRHTPTRGHGLKATYALNYRLELSLSRSGTLFLNLFF